MIWLLAFIFFALWFVYITSAKECEKKSRTFDRCQVSGFDTRAYKLKYQTRAKHHARLATVFLIIATLTAIGALL